MLRPGSPILRMNWLPFASQRLRSKTAGTIALALYCLGVAGLFFNLSGGKKVTSPINPDQIVSGVAKAVYVVDWSDKDGILSMVITDLNDFGVYRGLFSSLRLYQDGRPLGPPHSALSTIIKVGRGQFRHERRQLIFSTSDNTDPRLNKRVYVAERRIGIRARVFLVVFLVAFLLKAYATFNEKEAPHL